MKIILVFVGLKILEIVNVFYAPYILAKLFHILFTDEKMPDIIGLWFEGIMLIIPLGLIFLGICYLVKFNWDWAKEIVNWDWAKEIVGR